MAPVPVCLEPSSSSSTSADRLQSDRINRSLRRDGSYSRMRPRCRGGAALAVGLTVLTGLAQSAAERAPASDAAASSCSRLDDFTERLELRPLPLSRFHDSFLAHFEFLIEARLPDRADDFDLLPKPVGKFLNAWPAIAGFEATLSRGRWKEDEWGPVLREVRPPGAVLIGATNATDPLEADEAWKFLTSMLAGSLCASFQGMDPESPESSWMRPQTIPLDGSVRQLRFSTLPYEPVCTENLTPWLKLLPCSGQRGLASLLAPLAIASAPLQSLSLAAAVRGAGGAGGQRTVALRASLDVVLPLQEGGGLAAFFGSSAAEKFMSCSAAAGRSTVELFTRGQTVGAPEVLPLAAFAASAERPAQLSAAVASDSSSGGAGVQSHGGSSGGGLSVMRDMLSQQGKSERTHGRYLLRFTNGGASPRRVRFLDQVPFFVQPMWHTFHADFQDGAGGTSLAGRKAMEKLELRFVPSDGQKLPTEVSMTVNVPAGGRVSVFLDVLKSFIPVSEFTSGCEKGFDVGGAAWLEEDPQVGSDTLLGMTITEGMEYGRLHFTEGLLVMVPMPDFSMPFNVIALTSTALTFFFGTLFRMTAGGRLPHWVLKKEVEPAKKSFLKTLIKRLLLVAALGGLYLLALASAAQLASLRESLPPEASVVMDGLEEVKTQVEPIFKMMHML